MTDDPVLRELGQLRTDLSADLADIKAVQAGLLPREVYELRHQVLETRVTVLEQARIADQATAKAEREAAEKERRSLRRFVLGSVIVPIVVVILAYLLTLRGGGA